MRITDGGNRVSPMRVLEMLDDRFGAFEALAYAALELAEQGAEVLPPMDVLTANAILEFADDLDQAREAVDAWADAHGFGPPGSPAD